MEPSKSGCRLASAENWSDLKAEESRPKTVDAARLGALSRLHSVTLSLYEPSVVLPRSMRIRIHPAVALGAALIGSSLWLWVRSTLQMAHDLDVYMGLRSKTVTSVALYS
jgi:hypothetical protein